MVLLAFVQFCVFQRVFVHFCIVFAHVCAFFVHFLRILFAVSRFSTSFLAERALRAFSYAHALRAPLFPCKIICRNCKKTAKKHQERIFARRRTQFFRRWSSGSLLGTPRTAFQTGTNTFAVARLPCQRWDRIGVSCRCFAAGRSFVYRQPPHWIGLIVLWSTTTNVHSLVSARHPVHLLPLPSQFWFVLSMRRTPLPRGRPPGRPSTMPTSPPPLATRRTVASRPSPPRGGAPRRRDARGWTRRGVAYSGRPGT